MTVYKIMIKECSCILDSKSCIATITIIILYICKGPCTHYCINVLEQVTRENAFAIDNPMPNVVHVTCMLQAITCMLMNTCMFQDTLFNMHVADMFGNTMYMLGACRSQHACYMKIQ